MNRDQKTNQLSFRVIHILFKLPCILDNILLRGGILFDKYLLFECCLFNLSISNLYLDVLDYLICLFLALAEKSKMVENLKTELENLYTVSQELNQRKARQEKELDNLEQEIKLTKQGIVKYRVNTYLLPA